MVPLHFVLADSKYFEKASGDITGYFDLLGKVHYLNPFHLEFTLSYEMEMDLITLVDGIC